MPVEVILPKVDMDMESAIIESWKVRDGDSVKKGDVLFEIITNKAAMEIDAPASGVIGAISGRIGEPIPVGAVVAMIFAEGEFAGAAPSPDQASPAPPPAPAIAVCAPLPEAPVAAAAGAAGLRATPLARRTARDLRIDLAAVPGSGPRGRVAEKDVRAAAAGADRSRAAEGRLVPFDAIRRIASARLAESMRQAPHFYMSAEIDMTALLGRLALARAQAPAPAAARPSLTALIASILGDVLKAHPLLRASFEDNAARLHDRIDIAIAIDRDGALMAPVLRDVSQKSLAEIDADFARLKRAVRDRTIAPADLAGGVFTISNLGMYGVDSFTAIINPPQSAILAIGRTIDRPVGRDGQVVLRPMAIFSLSSDHRIVDGVTAARFMADLRTALETPPARRGQPVAAMS